MRVVVDDSMGGCVGVGLVAWHLVYLCVCVCVCVPKMSRFSQLGHRLVGMTLGPVEVKTVG